MTNRKQNITVLVLHNIRSAYNVGSIFRTADATGVHRIYLTGYTPAPRDRFGREVKEISKTALGAENSVHWAKVEISKCLDALREDKFQIIAVEQFAKSVDYKKIRPKNKFALIFGNEVTGLEKNILTKCDIIAEIPMVGEKESLNVSVAVAVALFRVLNI